MVESYPNQTFRSVIGGVITVEKNENFLLLPFILEKSNWVPKSYRRFIMAIFTLASKLLSPYLFIAL